MSEVLALIEKKKEYEFATNTCQRVLHEWWNSQPEGCRTLRPLHHALVEAGEALTAADFETKLQCGKFSDIPKMKLADFLIWTF